MFVSKCNAFAHIIFLFLLWIVILHDFPSGFIPMAENRAKLQLSFEMSKSFRLILFLALTFGKNIELKIWLYRIIAR